MKVAQEYKAAYIAEHDAIELLQKTQQPRWIPASERLPDHPENNDYYLVTIQCEHYDGNKYAEEKLKEAADAIEELQKRVPKTPHGRLIDADALIDKVIAKYLEHERKGELVFAAAEIKQDIVDIISDAPTIIESEGEE